MVIAYGMPRTSGYLLRRNFPCRTAGDALGGASANTHDVGQPPDADDARPRRPSAAIWRTRWPAITASRAVRPTRKGGRCLSGETSPDTPPQKPNWENWEQTTTKAPKPKLPKLPRAAIPRSKRNLSLPNPRPTPGRARNLTITSGSYTETPEPDYSGEGRSAYSADVDLETGRPEEDSARAPPQPLLIPTLVTILKTDLSNRDIGNWSRHSRESGNFRFPVQSCLFRR